VMMTGVGTAGAHQRELAGRRECAGANPSEVEITHESRAENRPLKPAKLPNL
jgi:hypothetical protein